LGKGEEGDEQRNDDEEEETRRMISEATAERRKRMRKEWRYGDGDGDGDEEAERFWEGEGVGWKMKMRNGRELQTANYPPPPAQNISYTLVIFWGGGGGGGGGGPDGRGCEMKIERIKGIEAGAAEVPVFRPVRASKFESGMCILLQSTSSPPKLPTSRTTHTPLPTPQKPKPTNFPAKVKKNIYTQFRAFFLVGFGFLSFHDHAGWLYMHSFD